MVLEKRYFELFVVGLFLLILLSFSVFAVGDLMALQGNVNSGGSSLSSGNITVTIYDAPSGGIMIYNSTTDFVNTISGGEYNILLGNGSNDLSLEYGKKYYMEIFANNERFTFGKATRQMFQAGIGAINSSFMNLTSLTVQKDINDSYYGLVSSNTNLSSGATSIIAVTTADGNRGEFTAFSSSYFNSFLANAVALTNAGGSNLLLMADNDGSYISFLIGGGTASYEKLRIFSSGNVNITNGNLTLAGTNARLGIGTESPTQPLTVIGSINATGTINATVDVCIQGGNCLRALTAGNLSWNESLANTLYLATGNLSIYNGLINNESYLSTYNASYHGLINNASYLSTYNATYDAKISDNASWNESMANGLYILGSNGTIVGLINNASYLSTYNATYAGYGVLINSSWNESRANGLYINRSGDSITGTYDFNGGWQGDGLTISGGDLFAQTVYVYNITSLAVDQLRINGTLTPAVGFDNTFDIGSSALRWQDIFLSGQVYSNGTGDNYFLGKLGIGTSTPTHPLTVIGSINATGTINATVDVCIQGGNCLSVLRSGNLSWNQSLANTLYIATGNLSIYNGLVNNESYLSTYNASYHGLINNESYLSTYNASYHGLINNESYLSIYNASYHAKADYNFTNNNFNGTGNFTTTGRIGIGIENPNQPLTVVGNVNITGNLTLFTAGSRVGIGVVNPGTVLEVIGNVNVSKGNITVDNNNRICLDGVACTHFMYFNGTHTVIE